MYNSKEIEKMMRRWEFLIFRYFKSVNEVIAPLIRMRDNVIGFTGPIITNKATYKKGFYGHLC